MTTAISEKAWSDYKRSDYSVAQWHQACLIHQHQGDPTSKAQCKLPVRTPDGTLNRNGVHAAAAALGGARGGVQASPGQMATAKAALKKAYSQLNEQAPSSLQQSGSSDDAEAILHYGTKGMKWGVRNDQGHQGQRAKTKKIAKLDQNFERNAGNVHTFLAIHNRAAQLTNDHDIDRINNKPKYKDQDFSNDSPLRRQYYNEHQQAFVSNVRKAASEMGTNASGTRRIEIVTDKNGDWALRTNVVQHADTTDYLDLLNGSVVQVFYDDMGHISRIDPPQELKQSAFENEQGEVVIHYGVRGMHWGVRRSEGSGGGRSGRKASTKEPTHEDFARATSLHSRAKSGGTKVLSNKEMQDVITRMNLEQQYTKLTVGQGKAGSNKALQAGTKFTGGVLRNVGQQIASEILKGHAMAFVVKKGLTAGK